MQKYQDYINNLQRKIKVNKKEVLFICIGNNEIIWDSIGPLVGSYLKKRIDKNKVLGDIQNNICCEEDLILYYPKLQNKFIIAIDAAIANKELEGQIFINESPIIMGLGVNKNKGQIGNISIKATVTNIKKTNKRYIENFSEIIGKGIYQWYNQ